MVVAQGRVTSLRRHKLSVTSVGVGTECGLVLEHGAWSDWQPGDTLQCVGRVRRRADGLSEDSTGGPGTDATPAPGRAEERARHRAAPQGAH